MEWLAGLHCSVTLCTKFCTSICEFLFRLCHCCCHMWHQFLIIRVNGGCESLHRGQWVCHSASREVPKEEWGTSKCLCFLSREMIVLCQGPDQGLPKQFLGWKPRGKEVKNSASFVCPTGSSPAVNKSWWQLEGGYPPPHCFLHGNWSCIFQQSLIAAKENSWKNCCYQSVQKT